MILTLNQLKRRLLKATYILSGHVHITLLLNQVQLTTSK